MVDHGHSPQEISDRIGRPPGRGVLRDVVYGAIDGSVTTFAIVAGVAGAGLSPFVIVALGLANVLADGFSMAAGNYSGTKAELDDLKRLRQVEENHIKTYPEGERGEAREILRLKGVVGAGAGGGDRCDLRRQRGLDQPDDGGRIWRQPGGP